MAVLSDVSFCTFGMFIIDEIEYINGREAEHSIIGGAGTYAAIGARLAAGSNNARKVSWIVDVGSDFPDDFKVLIDAWHTNCVFRLDTTRLTTRAWNGYGPNEYRAFKYLTPKIRLEEHSLSDDQVLSKSFHMVCSPERCISLVNSVMARRVQLTNNCTRPVFIWEPIPDLCTPEEVENLQKAATHVDVVSPNGDELSAFFASNGKAVHRETMISSLVARSDQQTPVAVVVRDGADGSTLYLGDKRLHLRAYHQNGLRVVDPTGGGNTYLGALAIGLTGTVSPDMKELQAEELLGVHTLTAVDDELASHLLAMTHATISASFAIEQTGMPVLSSIDTDLWNGTEYRERFAEYIHREQHHLRNQISPGMGDVDIR